MNPTERTFRLRSEQAAAHFPNADFKVFEARPAQGTPVIGGLVLVQEIFGVNAHIRSLARRYAERGWLTWAPAYFDHLERGGEFGVELAYDTSDFITGREFVSRLKWDQAVEDTRLTAEALRTELAQTAPAASDASTPTFTPKITAIGFCWGGSVAWLAACRLKGVIDGAVSYYGRATWEFRHEKPTVPVIMHFGERDASIPMEHVCELAAAQPEVPVYIYAAGHGFNCDARRDFDPTAADEADRRTMNFLLSLRGADACADVPSW